MGVSLHPKPTKASKEQSVSAPSFASTFETNAVSSVVDASEAPVNGPRCRGGRGRVVFRRRRRAGGISGGNEVRLNVEDAEEEAAPREGDSLAAMAEVIAAARRLKLFQTDLTKDLTDKRKFIVMQSIGAHALETEEELERAILGPLTICCASRWSARRLCGGRGRHARASGRPRR